jgi:DNA-binding MarR family transcriptional regulator
MSDDRDFNFARLVLGDLEMHRDKSNEDVRFGAPDLNHSHKRIMNLLNHDEWVNRSTLLKKTEFRKKPLKKHLDFLQQHDYIEERNHPEERRRKQYRRL